MSEVNDVNCAEPGGEGKSGRKSGLGGKRATIWGKTTPRPPRPGQAQPAGLGATFEALAGAKEPTQAVRIQLGEALQACGGHLLRPKVHERGAP